MNFDDQPDRRGTYCSKWDSLEAFSGVSPKDGLGMWVADGDLQTAPHIIEAMRAYADHGIYGYGFDDAGYRDAVCWWMKERHRWHIEPDWILTTQGLGHAIGMAFDTWTQPGDGVAFFTPVYHEFRLKTLRAERRPVELPMALIDGKYELDFETASEILDPGVKILIFCAPQNPSGRVWTREEMRQVAEFAGRHDLLLISDEIHADITFAPAHHVPMDVAAPQHRDRIVTITAASKAFNLPGLRTGQAIIPDDTLRAAYRRRLTMTEYSPGVPGIIATKAAYSPDGIGYMDALNVYLEGNSKLFNTGINEIPGLSSMPLQSTFLAWVDFSATGMSSDEITRRVRADAKIGASPGPDFGTGGETFHRFNLAMPRARVEEAVRRMQSAFSDLQ
ncbi:MAG: PatB family C-S lyase [Pseudomonadota bacterium]